MPRAQSSKHSTALAASRELWRPASGAVGVADNGLGLGQRLVVVAVAAQVGWHGGDHHHPGRLVDLGVAAGPDAPCPCFEDERERRPDGLAAGAGIAGNVVDGQRATALAGPRERGGVALVDLGRMRRELQQGRAQHGVGVFAGVVQAAVAGAEDGAGAAAAAAAAVAGPPPPSLSRRRGRPSRRIRFGERPGARACPRWPPGAGATRPLPRSASPAGCRCRRPPPRTRAPRRNCSTCRE